jgi:DNA-binding LytR/AlgR family response regulator
MKRIICLILAIMMPMIYKCIIIDDEPHAIEALKRYIERTPQLSLINSYTDPTVALLQILEAESVDLIFLDIDMPEISGIELAKLIRRQTAKLIFTTSHTKYAYEAFEVKADAYLLKPYSLAKFISTVQDLAPAAKEEALVQPNADKDVNFFFIKSKEDNHKLVKVIYDDIIAVESKQNYVLLLTTNKNILAYMSLTEIANRLTKKMGFIQLHRSFIIHIKYILSVEGNTITMKNGKQIIIGDYYRKEFLDYLNKHVFKAKRKE